MNHLIKAMIDKNILNFDTVVTANYKSKDCSGKVTTQQDDFVIVRIFESGCDYILNLRKMIGNTAVNISARDVIALDGMKPERYVEVYNINPDGSTKKTGKKRGRKPKL